MSALARIMLARGIEVSGSDARGSETLDSLRALGATIAVGHAGENIRDADTVVHTSAVNRENPELAEAEREGLRILPRARALAALMRGRRSVAVAGTHGKTTTAAMLTTILRGCGADPSFAIGSEIIGLGVNAGEGSGVHFVAEADESDASFVHYRPDLAVITNIEADHLDFFQTPDRYRASFADFTAQVPEGGHIVGCSDDHLTAAELARDRPGVETHAYGTGADAHLRIDEMVLAGTRSSYVATFGGDRLGEVELQVPGRHNVLDSAGALLAALVLGLPEADARTALGAFQGTKRRMEPRGTAQDVRVFDSYAHHPTEVAADVDAARAIAGTGRVLIVFQPHLYSRTRLFAKGFGDALSGADDVVVLDVYGAREAPQAGVSGAMIAASVTLPHEHVAFEPDPEQAVARLASRAEPGDIILTAGAGDVTALAPALLEALAAARRVMPATDAAGRGSAPRSHGRSPPGPER